MTLDDLLVELTRHDVVLSLVDGSLRVRAPEAALTPALKDALRSHREQLEAWLLEAAALSEAAPKETSGSMSFDAFLTSGARELVEVEGMGRVRRAMEARGGVFELPHLSAPGPSVRVRGPESYPETFLSFCSYNYLGYGSHPEVVDAAKAALDTYGLGATASPVLGGTLGIHVDLERGIADYLGQPGYGVSLFSSGYNANLGAISALLNQDHFLVCDRKVHMSILEGGKLAGAKIRFFEHNDPEDLERVLRAVDSEKNRTIVAIEGVYSISGAYGRVAEIAAVTKRHHAYLLVDEAHSMLLTGPRGRGVAAAQGVLDQVDLLVMTMSKSFGGVGGAVYAKEDLARYLDWYARCRMFSCALNPGVVGGLAKVPALADSADGDARRARLIANARTLRTQLQGKVAVGQHDSWIVPVTIGSHEKSPMLGEYLRRAGLEVGVVSYPAVPKDGSCLRLFVTSEHTDAQLTRAAEIILDAARAFDFALADPACSKRTDHRDTAQAFAE